VLERLPGLALAAGHEPAARGLVFRKPDALRVRWTARIEGERGLARALP
jgi:hypothetical protein